MATRDRTVCQVRAIAQDAVNGCLILANKRLNAVVLVPIFAKREILPDRNNKNAKFSAKIETLFTPSSYSLNVKTASGTARIFYALSDNSQPVQRQS